MKNIAYYGMVFVPESYCKTLPNYEKGSSYYDNCHVVNSFRNFHGM